MRVAVSADCGPGGAGETPVPGGLSAPAGLAAECLGGRCCGKVFSAAVAACIAGVAGVFSAGAALPLPVGRLSRTLWGTGTSLTMTGPASQSLCGRLVCDTTSTVACRASEMARKWLRREGSIGVTGCLPLRRHKHLCPVAGIRRVPRNPGLTGFPPARSVPSAC